MIIIAYPLGFIVLHPLGQFCLINDVTFKPEQMEHVTPTDYYGGWN